jgi:hypothetical protein
MHDTSTLSKYILFLNQLLGLLPSPTLLQALTHSKELQTIPRLAATLISKHLHNRLETDKGHHLHQVQQHVGSTHNHKAVIVACNIVDDSHPCEEICAAYNLYYFAIHTGNNPHRYVSCQIIPQQCLHFCHLHSDRSITCSQCCSIV